MSRKAIIQILIIVYCLGGILIYHFHAKWVFKPNNEKVEYTLKHEWKDIDIPMNRQSGMHLLQVLPEHPSKAVVLYFGSRKGNVWSQKQYFENLPDQGYEVIAMDYPGYGTSKGSFTEDSVYFRALTAYTFARARYEPKDIILYGNELGSAVAAYVATKKDVKAVVLEHPIAHYKDFIALPIYPLKRMLNYKFATEDYLKEIIAPVVVIDEKMKIPDWVASGARNTMAIKSLKDL